MGNKIKILFAIDRMNIGGAPTVVYEQIKNINKEKFDPYLLTLYPSKKANLFPKLKKILSDNKIKQFNLKNRSIFDIKTIWQIYKYIKKEKFNVVYTHLFLTNLIVRFVSIIARVPVILSFEHSFYYKKKLWQKLADKILSIFTDYIITPSPDISRYTAKQEKINIKKFVSIPNPLILPDKDNINIQKLKKEFNVPENKFVVMTLGRLSDEKGQKYFIEVASRIIKKNKDIIFLIIGHGARENDLRNLIKYYNLDEECRLIIEPERAKELLFIGDIFVSTSLREGQPIVILEAMKAGLPIIAFNIDGVRGILKNNKNALVVPVKDIKKLEEKIMSLYNNKNLRGELRLNADNNLIKYDIKKNIVKLEILIKAEFQNKRYG